MSIVVHDMRKTYKVRMHHGESKVDFHFRQLRYSEKSEIVEKTTSYKQGIVIQDLNRSDYLSIQLALIEVEGLSIRVPKEGTDEDERFEPGKNENLFEVVPYKLEFGEDEKVLDRCMDEIFNTPFVDNLVYTAKHLLEGVPEKIVHPFTKEEIEGVEIIYPKSGMPKKS